jgi:hypothetical protein
MVIEAEVVDKLHPFAASNHFHGHILFGFMC